MDGEAAQNENEKYQLESGIGCMSTADCGCRMPDILLLSALSTECHGQCPCLFETWNGFVSFTWNRSVWARYSQPYLGWITNSIVNIGGALFGSVLGASAAMIKGIYGTIVMRAIEGLIAFPGTLLALMLVAVVGRGQRGAIMAIAIYTIAPFARLTYTLILENESLLAIKAARSFGTGSLRILSHYYMPELLPRLLTQFSASVGSAIMTEAALSFLGLGVQPPNASWGLMLSEAKQYALLYPYLAVAPGVAIFIAVLGFHLLSDGLNDLLIGRRSDR